MELTETLKETFITMAKQLTAVTDEYLWPGLPGVYPRYNLSCNALG